MLFARHVLVRRTFALVLATCAMAAAPPLQVDMLCIQGDSEACMSIHRVHFDECERQSYKKACATKIDDWHRMISSLPCQRTDTCSPIHPRYGVDEIQTDFRHAYYHEKMVKITPHILSACRYRLWLCLPRICSIASIFGTFRR